MCVCVRHLLFLFPLRYSTRELLRDRRLPRTAVSSALLASSGVHRTSLQAFFFLFSRFFLTFAECLHQGGAVCRIR